MHCVPTVAHSLGGCSNSHGVRLASPPRTQAVSTEGPPLQVLRQARHAPGHSADHIGEEKCSAVLWLANKSPPTGFRAACHSTGAELSANQTSNAWLHNKPYHILHFVNRTSLLARLFARLCYQAGLPAWHPGLHIGSFRATSLRHQKHSDCKYSLAPCSLWQLGSHPSPASFVQRSASQPAGLLHHGG